VTRSQAPDSHGAHPVTGSPDQEPARPALRIVRGDATPEQVAALVAVLAASSRSEDPAPRRPRSAWSDPAVHLHGARRWTSRPS
jgi:hypothetical protein